MDDLTGLDWSASSNKSATKIPATGSGNYYTSIQPSPAQATSGRSTPSSAQASVAFKPPAAGIQKPTTPDLFSNLVSFGSAKQGTKLTLQEQQEKLEEEKAKKAAEQRRQYDSQFGHSQFWDKLSAKPQTLSSTPLAISRSSTPLIKHGGSSGTTNGDSTYKNHDDKDLFAAFNADTKVDSSSYYPPPKAPVNTSSTSLNGKALDLSNPGAWNNIHNEERTDKLSTDDDPFGLGRIELRVPQESQGFTSSEENDDFLGDLGKPVEEVKRNIKRKPAAESSELPEQLRSDSDDPWDMAVNELVDMGFSAEKSRQALTESGAGLDLQAAVGWLLNDAHRRANERAHTNKGTTREPERNKESNFNTTDVSDDRSGNEAIPAWMRRESRTQSQSRRDDSRSPANSDSDISRTAAAVGSNLLKTANSLWKTSQKKVQKAVAEFSQDSDPSQPKWMREISAEREQPRENKNYTEGNSRGRERETAPDVTDEALMLEADSRPRARRMKGPADQRSFASGSTLSQDQFPTVSNPSAERSTSVPRWQHDTTVSALDQRTRLNKQAVEEQSAQAYVSPARRKKPTPSSTSVDTSGLISGDSSTTRSDAPRSQKVILSNISKLSKPSTPIPIRPKVPSRNIPLLSPVALATSTQHRQAGTAHFKRGDYASAHASYTSSLSSIPKDHPITIVLLTNRSLTAIKNGDPKGAVLDADASLELIGPRHGENEFIDLGEASEGKKPMQEYWGKALTRKAEALEQMERWKDAGSVWQEAVEAGVGGATAIQGRQRCERALTPKPQSSVVRQPPKASLKPRTAPSDLALTPVQNTTAVNRLRAANLAAEKADDEKFALSDSVDARISKWRDGRKDNLRALLGGLDQVLWDGSGWKKVGMHELVVNSKVKIVYMKAIARVHPDKLPQDATTEIKMISASVFATLNEAWDKFKTDNGM